MRKVTFILLLLISVTVSSQDYKLDTIKSLEDIELSLKTWKEKEEYKKKELVKCDKLRSKLILCRPEWIKQRTRKEWNVISKELKTHRRKVKRI